VLVAVASCAFATQNFDQWMVEHGKTYGTDEFVLRKAIFAANVEKINRHNELGLSWKMGVNEFTDLTPTEFAIGRIGGYKPKKLRREPLKFPTLRDATWVGDGSHDDHPSPGPAPSGSVDWTKKGAVTPVKNQGQCGSCWSFSTTGSVEGAQFIKNKVLTSLSEQQLVDCSGSFGNQGCNGGLYDDAFKYIISNKGICSESSYPYTGVQGTCKTSCSKVTKISSYHDVTPKSDSALAQAIAQQPTSIAIEADQQVFQNYASGVLTGNCGTSIDHAVLAVGYGVDNKVAYFKVKNSWGASWGMQGYVLLARGESYNGGEGQCGIYSGPSYPIV